MQTSEGRVMVNDAGQYKYEYYLRDHLGSVRARFTEDANHQASLSGEVHYYPFGMTIAGLTVAGESSTDQLFSGKRLLNQDLSGTRPNWYDFGARNYDAQLGMWFNVDPMAEKYVSHTPYNYCFSNPVSFIDPDGREIIPVDGGYKFTGSDILLAYGLLNSGASINTIHSLASELSSGGGGSYHVAASTAGGYITVYSSEKGVKEGFVQEIRFGLTSPALFAAEYGGWYNLNVPNQNGAGIFFGFDNTVKKSGLRNAQSHGGGNELNPAIPASIAVGGAFVGGLEDSYKYGNHTVKYAQRINGQVRNAKVLTRASQMNAAKMTSGLKVVGRGVTGLSIATAGYQFATSDMSGNDYARMTGSLIITGTAFIPIVGPVISIGLGVADSYGAFDSIYNYFE